MILQHNDHFRDNGCRFGPPLTLFLTPLAPRRPRDREPLFLGLVQSNATKSATLPPNNPPSLSPLFAGPNIVSPKWLPTTYAPGLLKTAACVAYCMDCFNYKYGPPSYFLLAKKVHTERAYAEGTALLSRSRFRQYRSCKKALQSGMSQGGSV